MLTLQPALRCPHCREDNPKQLEQLSDGWFCNTCGKVFQRVLDVSGNQIDGP